MVNKKIEIIEIASTLIHSKGYEATSVKDIMDAAQIGKGQFYYYSSSKQDLGLAVIDYCFEKWQNRVIKENLATSRDPRIKIEKMLTSTVDIHQQRTSICGCFFGNLAIELSEHHEIFREKICQMFDLWEKYLTALIDEWRKEHELPLDCESDYLAQTIVALLEGAILLMKSRQDIAPVINAAFMVRKLLGMEEGERYFE